MLSLVVLPLLGPNLFLRTLWRTEKANYRIRSRFLETAERVDDLNLLTNFIGHAFKQRTALFSAVQWASYKTAGYNFAQNHLGNVAICWEASVGILVYLADRPALGMGIDFHGDQLHIRQLQGVGELPLNKSLQKWPKLFVASCVAYAEAYERIREVRVYKADQLPFYEGPIFDLRRGQTYAEERQKLQHRLRRRYDGTARQLGFKKEKEYYVWKCIGLLVKNPFASRHTIRLELQYIFIFALRMAVAIILQLLSGVFMLLL